MPGLKLPLPGADDLHAYGGLILLAIGCAWAWPPLGLIVPGALLFALGIQASVATLWRRP